MAIDQGGTKPRFRMIRKVSLKRAAQMREYRKLRREYLAAYPECLACVLRGKQKPGRAVDIHHRRGRAGRMLLAREWWVTICRDCHDWVGRNPVEAQAYDLLAGKGEWLKRN